MWVTRTYTWIWSHWNCLRCEPCRMLWDFFTWNKLHKRWSAAKHAEAEKQVTSAGLFDTRRSENNCHGDLFLITIHMSTPWSNSNMMNEWPQVSMQELQRTQLTMVLQILKMRISHELFIHQMLDALWCDGIFSTTTLISTYLSGYEFLFLFLVHHILHSKYDRRHWIDLWRSPGRKLGWAV